MLEEIQDSNQQPEENPPEGDPLDQAIASARQMDFGDDDDGGEEGVEVEEVEDEYLYDDDEGAEDEPEEAEEGGEEEGEDDGLVELELPEHLREQGVDTIEVDGEHADIFRNLINSSMSKRELDR